MTPETCYLCQAKPGDKFPPREESIPLCWHHWNRWLANWPLGPDGGPAPCGAHLIKETLSERWAQGTEQTATAIAAERDRRTRTRHEGKLP